MWTLGLGVTKLLYFGDETGQSGSDIRLTGRANDPMAVIDQFGGQMGTLSITSVG